MAHLAQIPPQAKEHAFDGSSASAFFHSPAWIRVLEDAYHYQPTVFTLGKPPQGTASLPVMEVRSILTGIRGVALPFSDECAPRCENTASFRQLFSQLCQHGSERHWRSLEIRGGHEHVPEAPASARFLGHSLSLEASEQDLFDGAEASTRRAVRKAIQSGVETETSTSIEALRSFYSLLCKTRRRHGVPPQPWAFFLHFHKHLLSSGLGCIRLASHQGQVIAGAVFLFCGKKVLYKYGASDETSQHLRANNLVIWDAIRAYARQGFTTLYFGRTDLANEGLRRFKLSWGAREYPISYLKYDFRRACFVAAPETSVDWYAPVFRRMPLPLSRLLGRILYRHIA